MLHQEKSGNPERISISLFFRIQTRITVETLAQLEQENEIGCRQPRRGEKGS
jgi:hypothetical protein